MVQKRGGSTRRHFLGVTAAAAGKVAAAAAAVSSVVAPSAAKAMGAKWWRRGGGGNGGGSQGPQCFLKGTLIQTPTGAIPIESLVIGDLVTTMGGRSQPIKWIGWRRYKPSGTVWPQQIVPVRIAAGALADNVPSRDLYVSPGHALLIDGFLIKAIDLVNDLSVTHVSPADDRAIEYFHIALDSHEAILAEGAVVETLLYKPGVHENYTNAAEFVRLYPQQSMSAMKPFAPGVGYGGRLHMKALFRVAFGRLLPPTAPAERIHEKIAGRIA